MRPTGDVHQALLRAATDMAAVVEGRLRGPTLQELAERAQVGLKAAHCTVHNMRQRGQLQVAGTRKVDYRNKPVAEYAPARAEEDGPDDGEAVNLAELLNIWSQG